VFDPRAKKVLVTGGANGIGLSVAREFARAGSEIILTDRDGEALARASDQLRETGARVHTRVCDISKRQEVEETARWVTDELGGLDVLINNAGIGYTGEIAKTPLAKWRQLFDVNFWGHLYHIDAFLPHMIERGGGRIVNVSSGQAFFRMPTWGAYSTVKAALGAYSEILHYEVRKHNVRVTTVYPFMVDTGFYDDVKPETLMAKLSMLLVPYYSMKPEAVAKLVFRAVRREKRVEMVSVINRFGQLGSAVPPIAAVISRVSNWLLASDVHSSQSPATPPPTTRKDRRRGTVGRIREAVDALMDGRLRPHLSEVVSDLRRSGRGRASARTRRSPS